MTMKNYTLLIEPSTLARIKVQRGDYGIGQAEWIRRAIEQGLRQWEARKPGSTPPW